MAENYEDAFVFIDGVECKGYRCEKCWVLFPQPMMAEMCCLTPEGEVQMVEDYGPEVFDEWKCKAAQFKQYRPIQEDVKR